MPRRKPVGQTDIKKKEVLEAYVEYGIVANACLEADVARSMWYHWIKTDKAFAKAVKIVRESVGGRLEEEAIKRACEGSDVLLIFLLKGLMPARYREKYEVSGPGGGPVITEIRRVIIDKVEDQNEK